MNELFSGMISLAYLLLDNVALYKNASHEILSILFWNNTCNCTFLFAFKYSLTINRSFMRAIGQATVINVKCRVFCQDVKVKSLYGLKSKKRLLNIWVISKTTSPSSSQMPWKADINTIWWSSHRSCIAKMKHFLIQSFLHTSYSLFQASGVSNCASIILANYIRFASLYETSAATSRQREQW